MTSVYKLFTVLLTAGLLVGLAAAPAAAVQNESAPEGDSQVFYALGIALSQSLAQFGLTPEELAEVQRGIGDGVLGKAKDINLQDYAPKLQALAQERAHAAAQMERSAGAAVVDAAAAEEGAVKTESGMVYKAIEEGTGASPSATDTVKVHYKGTLRDGSTFDSSYDRGQPATFPLNQVIPCWTEGVQKMKVGGKAKLVCPPDLAYGDRPNASIPAGSTLTFEVELIEIAPPAAPEGAGGQG